MDIPSEIRGLKVIAAKPLKSGAIENHLKVVLTKEVKALEGGEKIQIKFVVWTYNSRSEQASHPDFFQELAAPQGGRALEQAAFHAFNNRGTV